MIQIGQILNDTYAVTERINSGSGGIIYKAYHRRMQKNVAVKLIKDEIKSDFNVRLEIDTLKNLKNDFLPQVIDFVEDGNDVYTVMEFIEGSNFKQLVQSGKSFSEERVRKYAIQLCSAVGYLHKQTPPIIHSDIKPANIMLTPQDNICLIDFNISTIINNGTAYAKGGSAGFAAPEQFRQIISAPNIIDDFHEETRFIDSDETEILLDDEVPSMSPCALTKNVSRAFVDTRTDIYGIGASMYYMLTERIPVDGKIDFRGVKVSSAMRNIVAKAMHPNPAKRYASVSEMKMELKNLANSRNKANGFIIGFVWLLAAIAIGVGIYFYSESQNENGTSETESVVSETVSETTISEVIETETASVETATEAVTETKTEIATATESEPETVSISAEFSTEKLCNEIVIAVNNQREEAGLPGMKYDSKADGIADEVLADLKNGTFVNGTNYTNGRFDKSMFYYEKAYEISGSVSEAEAAELFLKCEADNYSSKWMNSEYTFIGTAACDNGDGTYNIVVFLAYNNEEKMTDNSVKNVNPYSEEKNYTLYYADGAIKSQKTKDYSNGSYDITWYWGNGLEKFVEKYDKNGTLVNVKSIDIETREIGFDGMPNMTEDGGYYYRRKHTQEKYPYLYCYVNSDREITSQKYEGNNVKDVIYSCTSQINEANFLIITWYNEDNEIVTRRIFDENGKLIEDIDY